MEWSWWLGRGEVTCLVEGEEGVDEETEGVVEHGLEVWF